MVNMNVNITYVRGNREVINGTIVRIDEKRGLVMMIKNPVEGHKKKETKEYKARDMEELKRAMKNKKLVVVNRPEREAISYNCGHCEKPHIKRGKKEKLIIREPCSCKTGKMPSSRNIKDRRDINKIGETIQLVQKPKEKSIHEVMRLQQMMHQYTTGTQRSSYHSMNEPKISKMKQHQKSQNLQKNLNKLTKQSEQTNKQNAPYIASKEWTPSQKIKEQEEMNQSPMKKPQNITQQKPKKNHHSSKNVKNMTKPTTESLNPEECSD